MQRRLVISSLLLSSALVAAGGAHASTGSRLGEPPFMATGYSHTLFLRPNGRLHAWGDNSYGEIGNGNNTNQLNEIVLSLSAVVQVAAGDRFSLAINMQGNLYSWGRNTDGQLGRGTPTTSTTANRTPVMVGTDNNWRSVAAGARHALAIKADGSLWAWGYNGSGQLGLSGGSRSAPTQVGSGHWVAIAAGQDFSIGLRADGTLWAAGSNASGQLGNPNVVGSTSTFTMISGGFLYRAFSAGGAHVLAIRDNGHLYSWGQNDKGQVGDGGSSNQFSPAQRGTGYWRSVAAGYKHSLAIDKSGVRYGWGENTSGEAGLGNQNAVSTPTAGASNADTEYVAAGKSFGMEMKATGSFFMWGLNSSGQLSLGSGVATRVQPSAPFAVAAGDNWNMNAKPGQIVAGSAHSVAIRSDGRLETWGSQRDWQLGPDVIGAQDNMPGVHVTGNTWIAIAAGETQTLAIKADGTLWAWGGNVDGEIGVGSTTDHFVFAQQVGASTDRWLKVAAHYADSYALRVDGKLYVWGDGTNGQLGDGSTSMNPRRSPVPVAGNKTWVSMAVSKSNGYGITSDGQLWAWGSNVEGQLCNGQIGGDTSFTKYSPIGVNPGSLWLTVGTGSSVVMALSVAGTIYGCGANGSPNYQLGESDTAILPAHVTTPTVLRGGQVYVDINVGHMSTVALAPGGALVGWGYNSNGELATGSSTSVAPPQETFLFLTRKVAVGAAHTLQIDASSGARYAVGGNFDGQLGDGTYDQHLYPVQISAGF